MTPFESCELRLSELFERHSLSPFHPVDTLSDLLESLSICSNEWLPFSMEVIETLRPVIPDHNIQELLVNAYKMEAERREDTLKRLVGHLLKAGIPVELDIRDLPKEQDSPAFTQKGKIYLDLTQVDEEVPIHEYTHLWATALRVADPDEWRNTVRLMKESELWEGIARLSQKNLTEDEIAEEVLSTFSGKRGKERLARLGVKDANANPIARALRKFWRAVSSLFSHHLKRAEEIADKVLSDFLSDVNPRETLQEPSQKAEYDRLNERRRDLFLGRQGVSRMDEDNLFGYRMDNLHVAERMESEGKTGRSIKMATGWERGVDGFWRYEIPAIQLKPLTREKKTWENGLPLESVLQAPGLFEAYPGLKEFTLKATSMTAVAAYLPSSKTIELNIEELPLIASDTDLIIKSEATRDRIREYLTHEIQHHIQNEEGFATGSNCAQLAYYALRAREEALKEPDKSAMQFQRLLNLSDSLRRTLLAVGSSFVVQYLSILNRDQVGDKEEIEERNAFIKKIEAMTPEAYKELVERAFKKRSTYNRWKRECEEEVYPMYDCLAGEIEARNASNRIHLSEKERQRKTGMDTMEYPAEEQYLFFKTDKPVRVGDRAALESGSRNHRSR